MISADFTPQLRLIWTALIWGLNASLCKRNNGDLPGELSMATTSNRQGHSALRQKVIRGTSQQVLFAGRDA
jgi:hypothetical protein